MTVTQPNERALKTGTKCGSLQSHPQKSVYFFIPNLIGYLRVVCTLVSLFSYDCCPLSFLGFYIIGFVLDAADGAAARRFNQCSVFGALLDMFVDRASTAGLVVVLASVNAWSHEPTNPSSSKFLSTVLAALLVQLDLASHYVRMYTSVLIGETSHKNVASSTKQSAWMQLLTTYYSNRMFMGTLCVGQELFYLASYGRSVSDSMGWYRWISVALMLVSVLPMFLKQVVNVLQLLHGMIVLAERHNTTNA